MIDPIAHLELTGSRHALRQCLLEAQNRRIALIQNPNSSAYRLVNAAGDGIAGLTLDHFDGVLVASVYAELELSTEKALTQTIAETFEPRAVYLKRRPREARRLANTVRHQLAPDTPVFGEHIKAVQVLENGLQYLIQPGGDLSVGLFLDMRDTRAWIRNQVREKTVLNAFSYTCGFGIAAKAGHATRVVNLDLSRRVLDWGAQNYALNGLLAERSDFIAGDVFDWVQRFERKNQLFDVVILDPPSFSTSAAGNRFSASADYGKLTALAAKIVAPGGMLLACCNQAKLSRRQFMYLLENGVRDAGRSARVIVSLKQSELDFPVISTLESPLKVIALEL